MNKYFLIILIILGFLPVLSAQKSKEVFTIYLVRHAEKDFGSDPQLTECGKKRADKLNNLFSDIDLDIIYSTDFNRTKNTAQPTASSKGLEINLYESYELENFSKSLINSKQNALIVGHSYTTGVLAGLLVGQEIGAYDLDIYNRIYKVVFYEDNGQLHLLHSSFACND